MKHRTTAGLAAFALSSALVLTGCGDGDEPGADASESPSAAASGASAEPIVAGGVCAPEAAAEAEAEAAEPSEADIAALKAIEITGDAGKEPEKVTFDTPFTVTGLATNVVSDGDGAALAEDDLVTIHDYRIAADTGEKLPSTWDEGQTPQEFTLGDPNFQALNEPLTGLKVGARLTVALVGQDGSTSVHVVDVMDAEKQDPIPTRAEGTPVKPADGLPTVELADDGAPTVTIPDGYEAPSELVVQPLIEGDGAEVTADDTVTAHYLGCLLDGTVFDASWSRGAPTPFPLNNVIAGWTEGLTGQKIGSQVLLVVPGDKAYADSPPPGSPIPADAPLIFVVDILSAEPAA